MSKSLVMIADFVRLIYILVTIAVFIFVIPVLYTTTHHEDKSPHGF